MAVGPVAIPQQKTSGAVSHGNALRICWAVHAAVGYPVTLTCRIWRRSWASTTKTKSTRNVSVGTTKKSTETSWPM